MLHVVACLHACGRAGRQTQIWLHSSALVLEPGASRMFNIGSNLLTDRHEKKLVMFRNFLWPHTGKMPNLCDTCYRGISGLTPRSLTINNRCLTCINAKMMNWDFDSRKKEVDPSLEKSTETHLLRSTHRLAAQLCKNHTLLSGTLQNIILNKSEILVWYWFLISGVSNGSCSLSLGSLYNPGLDLWHLYLIPVLISRLSNWSWSLSPGSVWSSSLGILMTLLLRLGSPWSSTWSWYLGSLSDSAFHLLVQTIERLQEEMLVSFPCSHRRGGAESLINTAVTRVKPPETCAT